MTRQRTGARMLWLLASLFLAAFPVHALTLSATDDGVAIKAGAMGTIVFGTPTLKNKSGATIPLVTKKVQEGKTATYTYYDDTVIVATVDDAAKTVTYDYKKRSPQAKSISIATVLAYEWRDGGKATFDGAALDFPKTLKPGPDGAWIFRGDASRFELAAASGQRLEITLPKSWQQLQDNRFWNDNKTFGWMYLYDLDRDPSKTSFEVKVAELAPGAPSSDPVQKVDQFGQTTLKDFPGKVKSVEELKADVEADKAYFAALKPPARDIYGGLPGSREKYGLKKTGYFHVEKIRTPKRGEMPVLVDPDGNLFFQLGLCSLGGRGDTPTYIEGRKEIYAWLPPAQGEFAGAFIDGGTSFSFYAANVIRKYGAPWTDDAHMSRAIPRLRQWGFNSEGAFSGRTQAARDLNFPTVGFLPFDGLDKIPDTQNIYDPFADGVVEKMDRLFAERVARSNNDPLLIGHFLGNEQHFENVPRVVPGLPATSGAKRRLVRMLREKYGDIARFNAAWEMKTPAASWDELPGTRLFLVSKAAADDTAAFYELFLETYYKQIADAYRKHCPNHILLGNRWLSSTANSDVVCRIAGKYLDVLSINYYSNVIDKEFLTRIHRLGGGRPVLLSEWHFGTTEQGLSGGVREVKDQRERGLAYRNYVEQAAALGFIVGHEWFSYLDQALTGRWFQHYTGERGNIGLVNVADRPYKDFLAEVVKTNYDVYSVLLGERAPFVYDDPRFNASSVGGKDTLLIPRALPGMTIDGQQNNWPGVPAERITRLVLGRDAGGVSADFRLSWDDANLYLLIQVKDPTPMVNDNKPDSLWAADSIELFIGHEKLDQGGPMQFTDRQVLLAARSAEAGYRWYFNNSPQQYDVKMAVVKNVTGDGYALEAAIPFAALGFTPKENQELLFDIGVNDNTGGRRQFMWNGIDRNSGDRTAWGRARLQK